MKNVKFTIFNCLPYEYKFLEKYLEDMALKGWKLKSITGYIFKFNRIEPKRIKYSVDVMDSITFFDGKNTDEALDYREYCKAAGWDFVCEKNKIQVYSSEEEIEKIAIQTDEDEKFKCIVKAALKYQFLNLLMTILIVTTQLNIFFSSPNMMLSSNVNLLVMIMVVIWFISEVVSSINFVIWTIKSRNRLNKNKEVAYNNIKGTEIKRFIQYLVLLASLIGILLLIFNGDILSIKVIAISFIITIAIYLVINVVSKSKYETKKKRKINIIVYVVVTVIGIIFMNFMLFRGILFDSSLGESKVNKNNTKLTLEDFNYKKIDEEIEDIYLDERNGLLASNFFYSETIKDVSLGYELFESKYEWIINYYCNRLSAKYKKFNRVYIEKDTELPMDIKVYFSEYINEYLFVSKDKVLEIYNYDNSIDEDELINKAYENIFK